MEACADNESLRHKKRALVEVIELQRKLIQEHDRDELASAAAGARAGAPAGPVRSDSSEEMDWYTEQARRLEKFKAALNALRLQPDEFHVLVPHYCDAAGSVGPSAPRASTLLPYVLRINARSQLTLVRREGEPGPADSVGVTCGDSPHEIDALRPRVFYVDNLRHVRAARLSAAGAGTGDSEGPGGSAGASRAVALDWKAVDEPPLFCATPEAEELAEVIGAHLRRYNQSRVATVQRLKDAHLLKCTAYSSANSSHERLLRRLWECGFPGVPLAERVSDHWLHLGFQGPDPATDFRGMGILGLANLVYFGEHYPDVFRRLVAAQGKRDYPLACAGINVTLMLIELLRMSDGTPEQVQQRPPFDEGWDSPMLTFFSHMFYRERPLDDMYCFCLRALDRIFVSTHADCASFPAVISALRSRVKDALAQRPLSFREFKRIIGTHESDSLRDSHSGKSAETSSGVDLTPEHSGDGREPGAGEAILAEVARMLKRNFSLTSP